MPFEEVLIAPYRVEVFFLYNEHEALDAILIPFLMFSKFE
jgi:hypothetical protein